ncbi:nucleotide sugar dehydrogenase [Candidatus Pelagibacter sp.]|nr:nucleotide sugar dehydrogenase [Candidatus Pelagibacter sp.]
MNKKKISVIGLGYIGLPFLIILAKNKFNVVGIENNKEKLSLIKRGKYKTEENDINKEITILRKKKIPFFNKVINSDIYILCLPTPIKKNKTCDTSAIDKVLREIAPKLKNEDTIIIESTVPIGFTDKFYNKLKKLRSDLNKIHISYVSEKAIPGRTIYEMINNDRVIGCERTSENKINYVYKKFVKGNIYFTSTKIAEASKIVENTHRDLNIGIANYLDNKLRKKKIDTKKVFALSNKHPRVNILSPSIGVGGHCLPVDPYFIDNNKKGLISQVRKINDDRTNYFYKKLKDILKKYKNKKICFWGLGYKVDSLDLRNSPSFKIFNKLKNKNYYVSDFKGKLNVKKFIFYKEALNSCKIHVIFQMNKKVKKYFRNKTIINVIDL